MRWPWQVDAPPGQALLPSDSGQASIGGSIAWLLGSLIAVSACALAIALFYLHGEALRSGEKLTESLTHVVEEQTSHTFQIVDQRLQLAADRLQALRREKRLNEDSAGTILREQLDGLEFVRALWVMDTQGHVVFYSQPGTNKLQLADREYFQVYQQHPATQFHLSAPVLSRASGAWIITASRPLYAADGTFAGVIAIALEPLYFDKLWRSIKLGEGGAIALFRRDGMLMMRSPMEHSVMGKAMPALPLFSELAKAAHGIYTTANTIDGRDRVIAYRTLDRYPELVVYVGSLHDDVLAAWRRFATLAGLIWLAAAVTVALLSALLYRYSQQHERTELRFRQLAQAMPQIVFITDDAGRMTFVNKQWTEVTGQPAEAAFGGGWLKRIHPDDLQRTIDDLHRSLESVGTIANEHRLLCRDGSYRWQLGRAIPNRDASGHLVSWYGTATDIHDVKQAEQELQAHLVTLQRAADAAQAITKHQTLDAMLHEVTDQARAILGAHQSAIRLSRGSDWAQAITALSMSEKYAGYRGFAEKPDGSGIYALVCETNRPLRLTQAELEAHPRWRGFGKYAGQHPTLRGWLAVPLTGRDGANIGLLQLSDKIDGEFTQQDEYIATELAQLASIAIENVSLLAQVKELNSGLEEKITQRTRELSRQEALFRALAEQAPHPIWTLDPRGHVTFISRAWYQLFGGAPPDWQGTGWMDLVHPDDLPGMAETWQAYSKSRTPYTGSRRLRAEDGSYHIMSYRVAPVLNDQGTVMFWVGIDVDITEIKDIEMALRLSNAELETFSYSVSHDLRSPLNTVDGFSRLLARELSANENARVQHYLARIQSGVSQMGQLIEGLLTLAQVSRLQLRREPVDLSALAGEIFERLEAGDRTRQVAVTIEPEMLVHGDSRLIRSVMENLLGNAWKFSSRQARAEISFGRSAQADAFFVRDNGAGFDMAYADKLFGTFQRLHGVTEYAGTGIGLATAARVVHRHGGRIWADAAPDKGATFFFTLPGSAS